jgi:cyclic-di-AMP phosphodiesterase PgpH
MPLSKRLPASWFSDLMPAEQQPELLTPSSTNKWWIWAIIGALVASILLPDTDLFPYQYTEGDAWDYADYRSPSDFYVPLPDSVVLSTNGSGPLYFIDNNSLVRNQQQQLGQLIREQVKISQHDTQFEDLISKSGAYTAYGQYLLSLVYERGVVNEADWSLAQQATRVALWSEQGSSTISADDLFTPATALDMMTDSLPYSALRAPELLLPLLERVIVPNLHQTDSVRLALAGQRNGRTLRVQKGELVVKRGQEIDATTRLKLDAIATYIPQPVWWERLLGNFIFSLLILGALLGWLQWMGTFQRGMLQTPVFAMMVVLSVLAIVRIAMVAGSTVPLLIPLYLLPLILQQRLSRSGSIGIWLAAVLLIAFGISWGLAWWLIQLSGAFTALALNAQVNTWGQRMGALLMVFLVQALTWWALSLTGHLEGSLKHPDVLLFLGIAATFSLTQSVLIRFFRPDLR